MENNFFNEEGEQNYEINLITVEDPPEYPIPGARQMPVVSIPTPCQTRSYGLTLSGYTFKTLNLP